MLHCGINGWEELMERRDLVKHNKKAYQATDYPNATGNTSKPKEVFPADQ
jgi:hypothetical protein